MYWKDIKHLTNCAFKDQTGVSRTIFQAMIVALQDEELKRLAKKHYINRGRRSSLSLENQLLLTLYYWRDYLTLYHLGYIYGLSESQTCRIVKKIDKNLKFSRRFFLPSKSNGFADFKDIAIIPDEGLGSMQAA